MSAPTISDAPTRPRRFGARFAIRRRLLLLVLALAVPFTGYLAISTWREAQKEREQAGVKMLGVARLTAARLDDHVGDLRQLLLVLSRVVDPVAAAIPGNDLMLRSLTSRLPPQINNLSVWSTGGDNVGTLNARLHGEGINVAERKFFREAMTGKDLAVEAPVVAATNGEQVGMFALPIERDGRTIGVVAASGRLDQLQMLLAPDNTLPPDAVITVTNENGVVLARSIDPAKWIGRNLINGSGAVAASLKQREGVRDGPSADGVSRIAGFTMAARVPWLVYVGIPAETALAPVRAKLVENLLVGGVMLLLGVVIAVRVGKTISRPLRQLSEDAAILEQGELGHRSRVDQGGEIGLLASTLNRMAEALEERAVSLQTSQERLSLALEGSGLALFDWDIPGDRLFHSAQAAAMRGVPAEDATTTPAAMREWVHPDDREAMVARLRAAVVGEVPRYEAEFRIRTQSGEWIWLRGQGRVVERDINGRALRLAGTYADITQAKHVEERLRRLAEFDVLTGLPNRAQFNDRLQQAIARAHRDGKPMALLFLDIDHFKTVNDSLGHEAGDDLLKTIGRVLRACVRTSDTVARLAGDEFTIVLEGLGGLADAQAVATTLVEKTRLRVGPGAAPIATSVSIGIAMLEPGQADPSALLRRADAALYEAKRLGRDRFACGSNVE